MHRLPSLMIMSQDYLLAGHGWEVIDRWYVEVESSSSQESTSSGINIEEVIVPWVTLHLGPSYIESSTEI